MRYGIRSVFPVFLLFLTTLFAGGVQAQEVYPGKSFTLEPTFSAGYLYPLGVQNPGGAVELGVIVSSLIDRVNLSLSGGYGYLTGTDKSPIPLPFLTLEGGYAFLVGDVFTINPFAGLSLLWPLETPGGSVVPAFSPGAVLDFHLNKRNYVTLEMALTLPFFGDVDPCLSFALGIKHTRPVLIGVPPVDLDLQVRPKLFSPDGDGVNDRLEIRLDIENEKSVDTWRLQILDRQEAVVSAWSGRGAPPTETFWDGYSDADEVVSSASDYTVAVDVEDTLGNRIHRAEPFLTDVFVHDDGGVLKIRVPGIIFPPGSDDFSLLSNEEIAANRRIIESVGAALLKFPDYDVLIEGHGNILNWADAALAEKEQREVLVLLSEARALAVKNALVDLGLRGDRLSVVGRGGLSPLVPFGDELNRWKNRRVEFILLK